MQTKNQYDEEAEQKAVDAAEAPWYVITVLGGAEEKAVERIRSKADVSLYDCCWIPTRTERRKFNGEEEFIRHRIFTGYVFISTKKPDELFLQLRGKNEFVRFLKQDSECVHLDEGDVAFLKRLTGWKTAKEMRTNVDMSFGVIRNGKLIVFEGPLVGMEEYITKVDRSKRKARLEMELFNEWKRFEVGLEIVSKD